MSNRRGNWQNIVQFCLLLVQLFQNGMRIHVVPCKSHIITAPVAKTYPNFVELKKYVITKVCK